MYESVHRFAKRLNSDNHGSTTITNGDSLLQKLTAANCSVLCFR